MGHLDQELVLAKIVEVHQRLRHITTVREAVQILLPALVEAVGYQSATLKVRDEDGLFRGYSLSNEGSVEAILTPTPVTIYQHFMKMGTRIANSYFASHEINVWESLPGYGSWEIVHANPQWQPGQWHPEDALLVPVYDQHGELSGVLWPDEPVDGRIPDEETTRIMEVFAIQAVAAIEIRRLLEQTRMAAITDGLTQLHTHRHFQECLEREVAEARRHNDYLSLLMLDLDHFKDINDHYGHPIGDQVLKLASEIFRRNSREADHVARYGGEEFAIILPRTDGAGALIQAERLREAIKRQWDLNLPRVTVSIGMACYPIDVRDKSSLITEADNALLRAKRMGRDCICFCESRQRVANG